MRVAGRGRRPGILRRLGRIGRDRSGVAAVEFAVIAPFLVMLYIFAAETSQAIDTNRKLSSVASTVGDLAAQESTLTPEDIDAIMQIGTVILQPYNRSTPTISLTAIAIGSDGGEARVAWSRRLTNGTGTPGMTTGTSVTIPEGLLVPGTFILRAQAELDYRPVLASLVSGDGTGPFVLFTSLAMGETYFMRPRMSDQISCDDC